MIMDRFVNLDVASAFSFLWGTFTPEELVKKVCLLGHDAVALTDIWGTYGIPRFWRACMRHGVTCIPGARLEISGQGWVVLLARNLDGYENLCRLTSLGIDAGQKGGKRIVSASYAKEFSRGLICITSVAGSASRHLAARGDETGAGIKLLALREIFRKDESLFSAVQYNLETDREANLILENRARKLGLPQVAVNHAAFLDPSSHPVHLMLTEIQRRHHHRRITPLPDSSFHICSKADMLARAGNTKAGLEAIEATLRIKELCSGFSFPSGRMHPPVFRQKEAADRKLARSAMAALARRHQVVPRAYIGRLVQELDAVKRRGLSDFFLLVHEICKVASEKGIRHSIRGSAAGSLIVHLLHSGPDPLRHNLLFHRFINDGRNDLPDIDIDFDSERRDEITRWLVEKLNSGKLSCDPDSRGHAALVATISTFRVRSAVRLAARAMGYPLREIDRLCRCLPWSLRGIPLSEAISRLPELRDSPLRHEKALLAAACAIEGLPSQPSVHLGGVILAPGHINRWAAVSSSSKGLPVAHLDKNDIEILGLLKLDLLGLRMHTAIKKSVQVLARQGIQIDIDSLPHDDMAVFDLISSGDTLGVFQLESSGQRHLACMLQPDTFNDIAIEISLFRPGPVQGDMVQRYLRRRQGRERIEFLHRDLKDILEPTLGVIVFQEQVLSIVEKFAGFSRADADAFRRAMTRDRSSGEMKRLKSAFINGAVRKGHHRSSAEAVYEKIAAFAAYGFCKAHATAFACITWQSAWLKTHHPRAFYIGLLNAGHVGSYPPFVILNEARRRGIPTLPPHINSSSLEYIPEGRGIRCPLTVIRGIGRKTAEKIVNDRRVRGKYTGWDDFFSRIQLPHRARHMLIFAGALAGLNGLSVPSDTVHHAGAHDNRTAETSHGAHWNEPGQLPRGAEWRGTQGPDIKAA